ncbi:isocitrate/isopropylmalate dehydrogenase family protein [bacterium]|nr:isocitrate/isopropylmalate dehydrogenase family protein [bacterium]
MTKKIVFLGGDGVGPEVSSVTADLIGKMDLGLEILEPTCGEEAQEKLGNFFSDDTKKICDESDAILFGATGGISGRILGYLRWELDNYINIRPIKYYPGVRSPLKDPEGIDFIILQEGIEGMYPGREGDISTLAEKWMDYRDIFGQGFGDHGDGKFAIRIVTDYRSRRFLRFSCEFTRKRKHGGYPGNLVCVTKANVLKISDGLFFKIMEEEIKHFPELILEHYYVDDMARRILRYPQDLNVVTTSNMFGDILSDEAAEMVGGLGLAASACIGGRIPYFEPVHGSAPKYAGKNVINPTAMMLSAKMMLDHIGMKDAAKALEEGITSVYKEGKYLTQDQGGSASTTEFTDAVAKKIGC